MLLGSEILPTVLPATDLPSESRERVGSRRNKYTHDRPSFVVQTQDYSVEFGNAVKATVYLIQIQPISFFW